MHPALSSLTLHLDKEFCLDAARCFALILITGTAQRVHLVYEDDGGLVRASQVKQVLHKPERIEERMEDGDHENAKYSTTKKPNSTLCVYTHNILQMGLTTKYIKVGLY